MKYICDIETSPENIADTCDKYGNYKPTPLVEKIICITLVSAYDNNMITFAGVDEADNLNKLWSVLKDGDEIVGFCFDSFDYPYLLIRSLVNNVPIKRINIKDLRTIICNNQLFKGKLSEYAKALGFEAKTKNGSQMHELYKANKWSEITEHCQEDVQMTKLLFDRMTKCNII